MIRRASRSFRKQIDHPVLLLAAVTAVVIDTYYMHIRDSPTPSDLLAFMMYVGLILMIPFFPRLSGCGVIVWYLLCTILPQLDAGSMLVGVCLAFATVFALLDTPIALILIGGSILELYLSSNADTAVAMVIVQTVSALSGYISKRHMDSIRQREELASAQHTVSTLSRDMAIAARLHDTVTNDLSYVITVATTRSLDSVSEEELRTLNAIAERSQDAFAKTHEVIDVLTVRDHRRNPANSTLALQQELKSIANTEETRLSKLGLIGNTTVNDGSFSTTIARQLHQEITGLVYEVYANLRRHCVPPADYTVIMNIQDSTFTLTAMNTLSEKTMPISQTSGKGLRLHQDIIKSIGGELTFQKDHDTWTIHAVIPLTS